MQTHNFCLFLRGGDALSEQALERLFEAGCDDATFGANDAGQYAAFHREDTSFARAVMTAIDGVERAVDDVLVVGIGGSERATASEIADFQQAAFIAALNGALAVRYSAGRLQAPDEQQAVAQLIDKAKRLLETDTPLSP